MTLPQPGRVYESQEVEHEHCNGHKCPQLEKNLIHGNVTGENACFYIFIYFGEKMESENDLITQGLKSLIAELFPQFAGCFYLSELMPVPGTMSWL